MTRLTVFAVSALCAAFFVLGPRAQTGQDATASHMLLNRASSAVLYTLVPVHGTWTADYEKIGGANEKLRQVLTLDGMSSKPTTPNPADVMALWDTEGAAFLRAATAAGAFPIAIARDIKSVPGTWFVDFKLIAGQTDQSAGIAFNIQPNGSYYFARYNTKDGNVAIWKFENGTRTVLAHGTEHAQLKLGEWHQLEVVLRGKTVQAKANGKLSVIHTIDVEPSGRVGVWAKPDSVTSFRNFRFGGHPHTLR
jgi:hypothetical protein